MNTYVMIGAGGTGSMLLRPLHAYLTAYHGSEDWLLFILDGDVLEERNLERQLFPMSAITVNKALAASMLLADEHHVRPIPEYLSEENITRFIRDGDTVLICADNFTVRRRIEDHARTLEKITVINGGNEKFDGSVQLWVRSHGEDITPRIGFAHPEIAIAEGEDRAEMTCLQAAALPGGEQTLIANMQSATWMLTALWRRQGYLHLPKPDTDPSAETWTEVQFDTVAGRVDHIDQRMSSHWRDA